MKINLLSSLFLISSEDFPECHRFSGYFFEGANLYQGTEGATHFYEQFGCLPSGQDGIFVSVTRKKQILEIAGDSAGLVPLFLLRVPGYWAVSPSFDRLLTEAKKHGHQLNILPDVLQAWRITGAIAQFPTTSQTCVAEITVVPTWGEIVCTADKAVIVPRKQTFAENYQEAINRYRVETIGRFRTIVSSNEPLTFDITGGIDSRSILATAWEAFGAEEFRALNRAGKISLRSNPKQGVDIRIANKIVEALDVELSGPINLGDFAENPANLSQKGSRQSKILSVWRRQRLGRSAIPQWNHNHVDGFWSSGVFGGNFKSPNPNELSVWDGQRFLEKFERHFDNRSLFEGWRDRVLEDQVAAQIHGRGHRLPFWPVFNRDVVMRMHARQYLGSKRLYPLSFKSLNDAANFLDAFSLRNHQIHHDLIFTGAPELIEIEYDKEAKSVQDGFSPSILAKNDSFDKDALEGRQFGTKTLDEATETLPPCNPSELSQLVSKRALRLLKDPEIAKLVGARGTRKRQRMLKEVSNLGPGQSHVLANSHLPHLIDRLKKMDML
ncbi:hypothetical protein SAMN05444003_3044 [Cognatiyoonia sediminum]|uniref:Asparagine synthase (Glutamine-hydrolysing) n=1 Tax=Cognatiyoonia sediminum TaxID=1508389 RepID=A0A1M5SLN1_9RHOB|nr:hypothetical protein [Cognatiyoonia sediminum]SHH39477.1 hypothetical protein SAMN05444003_3044 [Cognatiyoonia sediminum]